MANNPTVFVIGVGTSLLSLVRGLGSMGVSCLSCSSERIPGTVSRYARFHRIPDPRIDEEGMVEALIDLARRQDEPPIILTGCDQHAQALARHRARLSEVSIPCIAEQGVVDLLVHKAHFSGWAEKHVPSYPKSVPASRFVPNTGMPFPIVVKPNHRGFSNAERLNLPTEEELHALRFTLIETRAEWEAYTYRHRRYLPHLLVQEFVTGNAANKYSVCVYADRQSEIRALFVGRRLRGYPALFGDASLVQSDEVPEAVIAEVRDTIRALGYQGIAECEYNRDERTGDFRLLEINPRCWGWVGLTCGTDCDIPWIAYRNLAGLDIPQISYGPQTGSAKMVFVVLDMANVFLRFRRSYPQWALSPRQWWQSLKTERLTTWEFDRRDLRGSLWCLLFVVSKGLRYALRIVPRGKNAPGGQRSPRLRHPV